VQVHALLLADFVQAVDGKLYMLGGGWNVLNVATFPASHTVGIGVAIDISWNETNERHHADLLVEDADGTAFESPRVGIDFETGRPPGHPVGTDQRLVFAVNGPIEIAAPGSYSIVLRVSETELGRTRFQVVAKP
jgi:Family of unknown function (DUF6941)